MAALDLAGLPIHPFQTTEDRATVFLFVRTDCPISNRYAPEVRRLYDKFKRAGVSFWLVYPDNDESTDEIRQHVKDFDYPCGVLRDPQHALVRLCQSRVTPEAAVFGPNRQLIYHGRIDDRDVAFGKMRPEPTRHDLEEVLAAVAKGEQVTTLSAPAVGCAISRRP